MKHQTRGLSPFPFLSFWNIFLQNDYYLQIMCTLPEHSLISQGLVYIMIEHTLFRQSAHFVEVIIILRKNVSKKLESKRRKLAQLMLHPIDKLNVRLGNVLDVDLKITWSQNFPSHQKIIKNGESKYVLMKKVIVHVTTEKITMTRRYTHLWHKCIAMSNVQVKSMVKVRNYPIGS